MDLFNDFTTETTFAIPNYKIQGTPQVLEFTYDNEMPCLYAESTLQPLWTNRGIVLANDVNFDYNTTVELMLKPIEGIDRLGALNIKGIYGASFSYGIYAGYSGIKRQINYKIGKTFWGPENRWNYGDWLCLQIINGEKLAISLLNMERELLWSKSIIRTSTITEPCEISFLQGVGCPPEGNYTIKSYIANFRVYNIGE